MNKLIIALIFVVVVVGVYFIYTMNTPESEPQTEEPQTQVVEVYFGNGEKGGDECDAVFPVEREIEKTEGVGKAALKELLKGPTDEEEDEGYFTSINSGVEVNGLNIENGKATVDFSSEIEDRVGGSCMVTAIKAQIKETLKQFPTVDEVEISVEGQAEGVLQP